MKRCSPKYRVLMLFCSNAVLRAIGFAYRAALLSCAGSGALGLYSLVMQVYAVIGAICVYGSVPVVTSFAARTEREGMRALLFDALKMLIVLWGICSFTVLVFGKRIGNDLFHDPDSWRALIPMLVCILLTGIENALKSIHMGSGHFSICAFSELTEQCIRCAAVTFLIKRAIPSSYSDTVTLIILGMVVSELFSVSILSVSFARLFPKKRIKTTNGDMKALFKASSPAIMNALSGTLFSSAGALLLPTELMRWGMDRQDAFTSIPKVLYGLSDMSSNMQSISVKITHFFENIPHGKKKGALPE